MNPENEYHISFFRPTTKRALKNRNLAIWLVSIWAIAVFGFHIVLRIIEKPTPEPELITFNEVWPAIEAGNASSEQLRQFALSTLHVTGKVFINPDHRLALDNGITWAVMELADSTQKTELMNAIQQFNQVSDSEITFTDGSYLEARQNLTRQATDVLVLEDAHDLANILPFELHGDMAYEFTSENKGIVESAMPLYLTHNRSVLTDTEFLGFPFHYFYTAVFLLILFIGLCYFYCIIIDRNNKKLQISE
ncbi:MAG: hypothetical protein ACOC31_01155 [Bacteroidota bacterium]